MVQHLKRYCGLFLPDEIEIGKKYSENAFPGQEDITEDSLKAMVVPFTKGLVQMYNNREMRSYLELPITASRDSKIRSVADGSIWQTHPFFQREPQSLIIQLYEDDVEITNPLGSRTGIHKITNIYWSILNIPEHLRSNLKAIALLACVKSAYIKQFGFGPVLEEFFLSLDQMQSEEGLLLNLNDNETIVARGALICVNGDGLALNAIAGFKEGIGGATRPCRYCKMTREEMSTTFCENKFRDIDSHMHELERLSDPTLTVKERMSLSTEFGVTGPSVFQRLLNFDVTKHFPQDLMHNLLEGVAEVEIRVLIVYLIEKGNSELTLSILNSKIETFPYPPLLIKDKPSLVNKPHLEHHLRQKAAQMMCLLCVLPIILAPFVNEKNRPHIANFSLLAQITHRLLAYEINTSSIHMLKVMINAHHTRFAEIYPDTSLTPKFHFLVHAPTMIEFFGPSRVTWCMRYEANNAWFSQSATQTHNFRNITKTLANRYQIKKCLDFGFGNKDHIVLGNNTFSTVISSSVHLQNYPMGTQVAACLGVPLEAALKIDAASSICINNFELKQKSVVIFKDDEDALPSFAIISAIFVEGKIVVLVLNILDTIQFDQIRCAFEVATTAKYICMKSEQLPSVQPFPIISSNNSNFVIPMYYDRCLYEG